MGQHLFQPQRDRDRGDRQQDRPHAHPDGLRAAHRHRLRRPARYAQRAQAQRHRRYVLYGAHVFGVVYSGISHFGRVRICVFRSAGLAAIRVQPCQALLCLPAHAHADRRLYAYRRVYQTDARQCDGRDERRICQDGQGQGALVPGRGRQTYAAQRRAPDLCEYRPLRSDVGRRFDRHRAHLFVAGAGQLSGDLSFK